MDAVSGKWKSMWSCPKFGHKKRAEQVTMHSLTDVSNAHHCDALITSFREYTVQLLPTSRI